MTMRSAIRSSITLPRIFEQVQGVGADVIDVKARLQRVELAALDLERDTMLGFRRCRPGIPKRCQPPLPIQTGAVIKFVDECERRFAELVGQ